MLETSTSATTGQTTDQKAEESGRQQLVITMCRQNIVIRTTAAIDEGYTVALVGAVNSAAATDTVVVIDPEPVRCDDTFAGNAPAASASACGSHGRCEPVEAEVVNNSMIRIAAAVDWWTIDVRAGRFCQAAHRTHHLYVSPDAWVPIVAIVVTRTRLSALTTGGALITSSRAHRAAGAVGTAAKTA